MYLLEIFLNKYTKCCTTDMNEKINSSNQILKKIAKDILDVEMI